MAHENTGVCKSCVKLINRYPNFHPDLAKWFWDLQTKNPEVHTSCAGRGYLEQEAAFDNESSRAHFGQSAHNYNMALDLFQLTPDNEARFDISWYEEVIWPELQPWLLWYGNEGPYREYPHVEVRNWKGLLSTQPLVE